MIDRQEVGDALEEIGLLLDLLGESPFKTRAYQNASRVIRALGGDLGALVRSGEIGRLRGIGPALAEKIRTLVLTGELPYLQSLRSQVPPGLLEWLRIPGLGPKKARAIHVTLGISTLDELETACREGKVRVLDGFGETSERKILEGITRVRENTGRFLQPVAREAAAALLAAVRAAAGVRRAEVAGSVRRCSETSKDVDLVASAEDSAPAMDALASAPGVQEVTGRGPTKCSVRFASGIAADLRVVSDESYPFALAYFTGSKAHNIALRGRAQKLGLKLNEYALLREADGRPVPCASEEEIYRALGLPWIPPEIREDQGEIEAAEAGRLPRLLEESDLKGILHCHSTWSDGAATIAEMADGARALEMEYLGICDHSQAAAYAGGLTPERVREQQTEIDLLNESCAGEFRVLKGIEVDILPDGSLDYDDETLATFDLVVASVHSRFSLPAEEQTRRFLRAMENRYVDVIGHVTGRLLLARAAYALDLNRVLDAASERGIAVELNSHPARLDLDATALRYGTARGLKTAIDPDAHDVAGLSDIRYGVGIARKGWCTREHVLNALPLEKILAHLATRRRDARAPRPRNGGSRARKA